VHFLLENFNWIWLVTAAVSGGLLFWPALKGAGGNGIPAVEAVRLINREKGIVIDVREPGEFAAGHIVDARNVPLSNLDANRALPGNKQLPLIVVCASGQRSAKGAKALQALGHANVQVLGGGLAAWKTAGLPVVSSKAA
jgi:rhodanese-related sulfurtransferase